MSETVSCPLCDLKGVPGLPASVALLHKYRCPNCGTYEVSVGLGLPDRARRERALLSHVIKKAQRTSPCPVLTVEWCEHILKGSRLPNPAEQADNLILWLGEELERQDEGRGLNVPVMTRHLSAVAGSLNSREVAFVLDSLVERKDISRTEGMKLTFQGWERYDEIKRRGIDTKKAFMAMAFREPDIRDMYEKHLKPAAAETDFELLPLDEEPTAGIIDVNMEVAIRNAAFVVADLTHNNLGVYWEAGFATALDKPVIYTCRDDMKDKIHFDTNHRHCVYWDLEKPDEAVKKLKATIRATLPDKAKMEDDPDEPESEP